MSIWMVQWSSDYSDYSAAFTSREKAIAYVEGTAASLDLYEREFERTADWTGFIAWEFEPEPAYAETEVQTVFCKQYELH